jgi:uncharacterized protein
MSDLWAALALMLVFEGMMPFISPKGWRQTLIKLVQLPDKQVRQIGFGVMVVGLVVLSLVR